MKPELIARYDQRVPRYTSYPTAPQFNAGITGATYASWLSEIDPKTVLSLYLHVPFCAELCLYCGCHTAVVRSYSPVESYVECLKREIALVAAALPAKMAVSHIHWGGGTPTLLKPEDLSTLLALLRETFDFRPGVEIAVEIDPRVLTLEHVKALAGGGLTRASLGVQDFDPKVQETVNRIQPFETTSKVAQWLRDAGVNAINLDLMYGLPHQTVESVSKSVDMAINLAPDRVALFGYAHVPWMKKHQSLLPEEALPDTDERVRQMLAAEAMMERRGYVPIGIDHYARPDDPMAMQQHDGRLRRNFQGYTTDEAEALIGFGTSAIGFLPQGYIQNASATVPYRSAIMSGTLATARGIAVTPVDRMRRAIIERLMCDFSVDLDAVTTVHGMPETDFTKELARVDELAVDGIVIRNGKKLTVPKDARPLVRLVCAVFDEYFTAKPGAYSKAL